MSGPKWTRVEPSSVTPDDPLPIYSCNLTFKVLMPHFMISPVNVFSTSKEKRPRERVTRHLGKPGRGVCTLVGTWQSSVRIQAYCTANVRFIHPAAAKRSRALLCGHQAGGARALRSGRRRRHTHDCNLREHDFGCDPGKADAAACRSRPVSAICT